MNFVWAAKQQKQLTPYVARLAAVEKHLNELDETSRYGVWIPYELSLHQLQYRVDVCMDLMTSYRNYQWLRNSITGDEKWVLYINYKHRRQWLSADENRHGNA